MNGYKDDPLQINDNQSDPLQPITNSLEPDVICKPSNQSPLQYRSVKSISHESHLDKYTHLKIYNGTPQAKQGVPLEIQVQQLPINELSAIARGTPPQAKQKAVYPISNLHRCKEERTDTLRLTQEFNKKFFNQTKKSIEITHLSIMKDDIKNYRSLTELQLTQLETFTEEEKIEIIKTYNIMFSSLENVL